MHLHKTFFSAETILITLLAVDIILNVISDESNQGSPFPLWKILFHEITLYYTQSLPIRNSDES